MACRAISSCHADALALPARARGATSCACGRSRRRRPRPSPPRPAAARRRTTRRPSSRNTSWTLFDLRQLLEQRPAHRRTGSPRSPASATVLREKPVERRAEAADVAACPAGRGRAGRRRGSGSTWPLPMRGRTAAEVREALVERDQAERILEEHGRHADRRDRARDRPRRSGTPSDAAPRRHRRRRRRP